MCKWTLMAPKKSRRKTTGSPYSQAGMDLLTEWLMLMCAQKMEISCARHGRTIARAILKM